MRAVYIVVEGQTEEEFVNTLLRPFFVEQKLYDVRAILLSTSKEQKGGDMKYARYKSNVERLLKQESDILVTSFIDFFRLKNDFPKYDDGQKIEDKIKRVDFLEQAISEDINNPRFVPYIQLHEFEGLLFSSDAGFNYLSGLTVVKLEQLKQAMAEKHNPELLNDGPLTAPSKRLDHLIPGYGKKKVLYGPVIAEAIGLAIIRSKCDRFRRWLDSIIQTAKSNP